MATTTQTHSQYVIKKTGMTALISKARTAKWGINKNDLPARLFT
jgi:hypothetical protein